MATARASRADETRAASGDEPARVAARVVWLRHWQDVLITALLAGFMLSPVVALIAHGYSATGMAEESLGRRYFYSLRIVYGEHERPWVPQGHLVSVAHMGVQYALTASGFPPTQVFPRIDIFGFAVSVIPILLAVFAFVWAVRPIASDIGKLLVALVLLKVVFDPGTTRGYQLVQADYYSWVYAIALVGLGWMLRIVRGGTALDLRTGAMLGLYAAAAISIKPTYLTFVLPPAIVLIVNGVARRDWHGVVLGALAASAISVAGVAIVLLTYYVGDVAAIVNHVISLATFVEGIVDPQPFQTWLQMAIGRWVRGETVAATAVLVPILALSLVVPSNRLVTLSLLPGAIAAVYVAWRKFYPNTLLETNEYAFFAIVVWSTLVLVPALQAGLRQVGARFGSSSGLWLAPLPILGLVVALMCGDHLAEHVADGRTDMLRSFGAATRGSRSLSEYLASRPGSAAFLIPDNAYRPLTVDSAIYKGGTNELDARWGMNSTYVSAMFPDRHYFVGGVHPAWDPDLSRFNRIAFVKLAEEDGDAPAARRVQENFGIWLRSYDCSFRADVGQQEIIVCERRVVPLARNEGQSAQFAPVSNQPTTGGVTPDEFLEQTSAKRVATYGVNGRGLILWQVQADGSVAAIDGPEGARIRIDGLGAWNPDQQVIAGAEAAYTAGRWQVNAPDVEVSNENPSFARPGSRRQPLFGWQLEPRGTPPVVEHTRDEGGPFIRVRPTDSNTAVEIYSRAPLSKLDGVPVTVRAVIRVHGNRPATLSISDVVAPGAQPVTRRPQRRRTTSGKR
jgi:hypothetical protein